MFSKVVCCSGLKNHLYVGKGKTHILHIRINLQNECSCNYWYISQVMESFARAESRLRPNPENLFKDVYYDMEWHIQKQQNQMKEHVSKYKEHYPIDKYEKWDGL